MSAFTIKNVLVSLRSTTCPACAGRKIAKQTVCIVCWKRLPKRVQAALYRPLADGYTAAVRAALVQLGTDGNTLILESEPTNTNDSCD